MPDALRSGLTGRLFFFLDKGVESGRTVAPHDSLWWGLVLRT
jgi:hypothetical protein